MELYSLPPCIGNTYSVPAFVSSTINTYFTPPRISFSSGRTTSTPRKRSMRVLLTRCTLAHSRSTIGIHHVRRHARSQSTSTPAPATDALSPRWLSDVKTRIGKCISFGIGAEQTREAGSVLAEVARDWRELVGGSEGFLTGKEWRGLYRQEVVWGEMVVLHRIRY